MAKNDNVVEMRAADSSSSLDDFRGTSEDAKDMYRLGRKQELSVRTSCGGWDRRLTLAGLAVLGLARPKPAMKNLIQVQSREEKRRDRSWVASEDMVRSVSPGGCPNSVRIRGDGCKTTIERHVRRKSSFAKILDIE